MTRTGEGPSLARPRGRQTSSSLVLVAVLTGLVGSGLVVLQGTNAAFTGVTSNTADAWTAGTLALSDDDAGVALFTTGPIVPGQTGTKCLTVTYNGSLATTVKVYAAGLTGTLGPNLQLTVEQGTGGSFGDCSGFDGANATQIWSGTLATLAASATSYANGIGTWAPTGPGVSRTYRFTWTLDPATPNNQQGATASASFVWEAQS